MRCSLVELTRLNAELTKQNERKDRELEELKKAREKYSPEIVAALQQEILALKKHAKEVSHSVTQLACVSEGVHASIGYRISALVIKKHLYYSKILLRRS